MVRGHVGKKEHRTSRLAWCLANGTFYENVVNVRAMTTLLSSQLHKENTYDHTWACLPLELGVEGPPGQPQVPDVGSQRVHLGLCVGPLGKGDLVLQAVQESPAHLLRDRLPLVGADILGLGRGRASVLHKPDRLCRSLVVVHATSSIHNQPTLATSLGASVTSVLAGARFLLAGGFAGAVGLAPRFLFRGASATCATLHNIRDKNP